MRTVLLCCGILAGCGIVDSFLLVNPRAADKRGDFFGSTAAFGKRGISSFSGDPSFFDTTASFGKRDPLYPFYDASAGFGKRAPAFDSYLLDASAAFGKRAASLVDASASFGKRDDGFFLHNTAALGRR